MRRGLSVVVVLLMLSGTSWAQDVAGSATVPAIAPRPETFAPRSAALTFSMSAQDDDRPAPKIVDKKFVLVVGAMNAAMIADTKSTFDVMHRCDLCYEANPYAAPFINRGPAVAFTAGEAFDVSVMVIAAKMKGSDRPLLRKTWWVIPVVLTAGHLLAMQHNMNLAR